MKKHKGLVVFAVSLCLLGLSFCFSRANCFARSCGGVETVIFECDDDDGKGGSICHILNFIAEIITIGVGILGVIGISVTGIQYLTGGGNEEKIRKAKRRMFQIIIGLAIYVSLYVIVLFLLPGGNFCGIAAQNGGGAGGNGGSAEQGGNNPGEQTPTNEQQSEERDRDPSEIIY